MWGMSADPDGGEGGGGGAGYSEYQGRLWEWLNQALGAA